jgi:hypothetical protein
MLVTDRLTELGHEYEALLNTEDPGCVGLLYDEGRPLIVLKFQAEDGGKRTAFGMPDHTALAVAAALIRVVKIKRERESGFDNPGLS